jgi:general nucleoside transport system permease protein
MNRWVNRLRPRPAHITGVTCVVGGFGLVALLVAVSGGNVTDAAVGWFHGAFGTWYNTLQTLTYAAPLVLIALGASVALRAGVVVVGAEGQMIVGATVAAAVLLTPAGSLSAALALPLGALAGIAGGVGWSLLPGVALVRWQVNEILSALLATYLAVQLLTYLLRTVLRDRSGSATLQSAPLPETALIPQLPLPGRFNAAAIMVLVLVVIAMWWHRSRSALLLDVYAQRRWLAGRLHVTSGRAVLLTTAVSGAAAGLAGWAQLAGVDGRLHAGITGGIGFSGLVVAVLGGNRPVPILFAGVLFACLTTGSNGIQLLTGIPASIGTVTQAVLLAAAALAVVAQRRASARQRERARTAEPNGDGGGDG